MSISTMINAMNVMPKYMMLGNRTMNQLSVSIPVNLSKNNVIVIKLMYFIYLVTFLGFPLSSYQTLPSYLD